MRHLVLGIVLIASVRAAAAESDPFVWLEQVNGERAMEWVRAENVRTAARLEQDPRYAQLYREALAIAGASDKIPMPTFQAGKIYNLWQDSAHPHGLWRRTTLVSYRQGHTPWHSVLDLDELAAREHANWFLKGVDCNSPAGRRCLLQLSDGGEDAVSVREFDLDRGLFVDQGFSLPRGKQFAAWMSGDALLVAHARAPEELTESGYPFVVRRLERGHSADAATVVFRGQKSDVQVMPVVFTDGSGARTVIIQRDISFFEHEYSLVVPEGLIKLPLPLKSDVHGVVAGRLIVSLNTGWVSGAGVTFAQGSLLALPLDSLGSDPRRVRTELVYVPGARDVLQQVAPAGDRLLITLLDNVRGRAFVYGPAAHGLWSRTSLALPDNATIDVVDTDRRGHQAFVSATSFLTPTSLWLVDLHGAKLSTVKVGAANFDAARETVEQLEAVSADGTHIPYFVVHRTGAPLDGSTPTVMTAYGGFQVAVTPYYGGYEWLHEPLYTSTGKLWLERGGTFVLANIRGGAEFGPAWHEAGLKTQRQRIYDDFAAVARDLIARGITSPRRLGITGLSNGGLLMGVEFTQHPELWGAVDIAVPLLDMLNYEHIEAGASWVSEYGSVDVPLERAFLATISPYDNLRADVAYPEPLIWSTSRDDRVGPEHARKFAAKLAALGKPYLYFEALDGGHDPVDFSPELTAAIHAREFTYFMQRLVD